MADMESCSQCGWTFDVAALKENQCRKCRSAILVTSIAYLERFDRPAVQKYISQYSEVLRSSPADRDALLAMGICYLRLGLYDVAQRHLEKLMTEHPADGAGYYYGAIATFKGRRPRVVSMDVIRRSESLITTAMELEPASARHDLLLAAVRQDYYAMNGLRMPSPGPAELLGSASGKHLDAREVEQGLALLNIGGCPILAAVREQTSR